MGHLTQTRMGTVRRLLEQAPDAAVHDLERLIEQEADLDLPVEPLRDLLKDELADRRLREDVFAPLAPLFTSTDGRDSLRLPTSVQSVLWRDVKTAFGDGVRAARTAVQVQARQHSYDLLDTLCLNAGQALQARDGRFSSTLQALDAQAGGLRRLALLLQLAPLLRRTALDLPAWLASRTDEHHAAVKAAWNAACDLDRDAGPAFIEMIYAQLERPAEMLRLVAVVMDRPTDRLFAIGEFAPFGERLLARIDLHLAAVRRFDPQQGVQAGVDAAAAALGAHLDLGEFEDNLRLVKDGVWGGRVAERRRSLAVMMENQLREVEAAVAAALPAQAVVLGGKRLREIGR